MLYFGCKYVRKGFRGRVAIFEGNMNDITDTNVMEKLRILVALIDRSGTSIQFRTFIFIIVATSCTKKIVFQFVGLLDRRLA